MVTWDDLMYSDGFLEKEAPVLERVAGLVKEGALVYPSGIKTDSLESVRTTIYRALELTPLAKVKVVILGQDPYHGPGQANGLAFSVNPGVVLPPSLKNIFKELQSDLGGKLRVNGDLSDWAKQGVLLLNCSLSVEEGKPNSMSAFWEPITDEVIRFIDSNAANPVIFVLWGNNAKSKKKFIVNNRDYIIESVHPSPLSANRGFFGSKPFSKINWILSLNGCEPIIWN